MPLPSFTMLPVSLMRPSKVQVTPIGLTVKVLPGPRVSVPPPFKVPMVSGKEFKSNIPLVMVTSNPSAIWLADERCKSGYVPPRPVPTITSPGTAVTPAV